MSYFLKKTTPGKKGIYLQIYEGYYIAGEGKKNRCYKTLGYVKELEEKGIKNPIAYYQKMVENLNEENSKLKISKIHSDNSPYNLGYFLLKVILDKLNLDSYFNKKAIAWTGQENFFETFRIMLFYIPTFFSNPSQKFDKTKLFNLPTISLDKIKETLDCVGEHYMLFIDKLNEKVNKIWDRKNETSYYQIISYYFSSHNIYDYNNVNTEMDTTGFFYQELAFGEDLIPTYINLNFINSKKDIIKFQKTNTLTEIKNKSSSSKIIFISNEFDKNEYSKDVPIINIYSLKGYSNPDQIKDLFFDYHYNSQSWICLNNKDDKTLYWYRPVVLKSENTISTTTKHLLVYDVSQAQSSRVKFLNKIDKIKLLLKYDKNSKIKSGDLDKYTNINDYSYAINRENILNEMKSSGYSLLSFSYDEPNHDKVMTAFETYSYYNKIFQDLKKAFLSSHMFVNKKSTILGFFVFSYYFVMILKLLEIKLFNSCFSNKEILNFINTFNFLELDCNKYINRSSLNEILLTIKEKFSLDKMDNLYLTKKDLLSFLKIKI